MQVQQLMQQAQQNPQMVQQAEQAKQQFMNEKESKIAELEAIMIAEMAKQEQIKAGNLEQDPLIRLKQQEIDLKAAEMTMKGEVEDNKLMADIGIEAEKIDLAREQMKGKMEETIVKEGIKAIEDSDKETIEDIRQNMETLREDRRIKSAERIAQMNRGKNDTTQS